MVLFFIRMFCIVRFIVLVKFCPFDGLPCKYVDSCDDALALKLNLLLPLQCSRAVVPLKK